jgi:hypothetical protein
MRGAMRAGFGSEGSVVVRESGERERWERRWELTSACEAASSFFLSFPLL